MCLVLFIQLSSYKPNKLLVYLFVYLIWNMEWHLISMGAPKLNISWCQFLVSISSLIDPYLFGKSHLQTTLSQSILIVKVLKMYSIVTLLGRASEVKLAMFHALLYGTSVNFLNKPLFIMASDQ